MKASDFVLAITSALNRGNELLYKPCDYISHMIALKDCEVEVDLERITQMGIEYNETEMFWNPDTKKPLFAEIPLVHLLNTILVQE